ncbi:SprT family zinc-dependent metalloprotease [Alteromonas ponticola]|uniref:SprT family zinc-dependent metalloprotease n=1 Tax=Alteromonas ponticola TaxID=2720613 RepID=A0ABX1R0A1_9ALTE|nr:SprT family zinc-dependent metalloprotease [Alteromonas ponticola]NMH58630.1 SprT family zinc-dependent metalloprotease [Alteromonas ponticola]
MSGKITLQQPQIDAVHQRCEQLVHQASTFFKHPFPTPTITFNRSGKNAGTAFLQQNRINFHPILLVENWQEYINQVVPHEVAHLVVYQQYGRRRQLKTGLFSKRSVTVKPHGVEWQHVMEDVFQTRALTTHNFDISSLGIRTVSYACQCQTVELTVRRHNRILRGARYCCKRCNSELIAN